MMTVWTILLWAGAGGIGLFWLIRLIVVEVTSRDRALLSPQSYAGPPSDAPTLSVVVAAKDEENDIETCIRFVLAQDYPDFELIVVDDRSQDETPNILERLKREFAGRLKTITVQSLPDGWCGKNHAMHLGVAAAGGDWLLFTDADCRHTSPKVFSMAMSEAFAHDVDFLSVIPTLDTPAVWEKVIQPVCVLTMILWFLPHRVNNPAQKTAYANGALMLLRRRCYDAIGGHEGVRMEMNEDVRMAQLTKRMGMDLRVAESDGLYQTRMYDSLAGGWRGWSRILAGCLRKVERLWISTGLLVLLTIIPWVIACTALVGSFTVEGAAASSWRIVAGAWFAALVVHQISVWRLYRLLCIRPIWSLTYVIGAIATVGVLFSAILKTMGATTVTWRGTEYHAGRPDQVAISTTDGHTVRPANEV